MELMLYPTNLKVKKISKKQKILRKLRSFASIVKKDIKYLILDRKNLGQKIASKFHV